MIAVPKEPIEIAKEIKDVIEKQMKKWGYHNPWPSGLCQFDWDLFWESIFTKYTK